MNRQADILSAQMRDKNKIDEIKKKYDLSTTDGLFSAYEELQSGNYEFETKAGRDFDDEIFEKVSELKKKNIRPSNKNSGKVSNNKSVNKKSNSKLQKKKKQISLDDFDEDMKREILEQIKIREKRRKLLVRTCSLLAILCIGYFSVYYYMTYRNDSTRNNLSELKEKDNAIGNNQTQEVVVHKTSGDIEMPDILDEYKTLYNKNKSLIGWVKIDDTNIDYPVMQTANNDYYLTHDFEQEYDKNGSIFMDAECVVYPRSTNLIIYGHHMKSGKMFGELDKYAKEEFYKEHPTFTFDTIYEKGTYQVMYVFRSRIYAEDEIVFKYYQFIDAASKEAFDSNMNEMKKLALYDTGVTAEYGDGLVTLSTCDHSIDEGRFVVVGKKVN